MVITSRIITPKPYPKSFALSILYDDVRCRCSIADRGRSVAMCHLIDLGW